jgi:hypothetical protein
MKKKIPGSSSYQPEGNGIFLFSYRPLNRLQPESASEIFAKSGDTQMLKKANSTAQNLNVAAWDAYEVCEGVSLAASTLSVPTSSLQG